MLRETARASLLAVVFGSIAWCCWAFGAPLEATFLFGLMTAVMAMLSAASLVAMFVTWNWK